MFTLTVQLHYVLYVSPYQNALQLKYLVTGLRMHKSDHHAGIASDINESRIHLVHKTTCKPLKFL